MQAVLPASSLHAGYPDKWDTASWYALYTRSRHERSAHEELTKRGIETFLPVRKITRRWSDRKKVIEDPLFKGYLFVNTALKRRWDVLNTKGVVCFVGSSAANPVRVPEKDLIAIRKFIEEEIAVNPYPYLKVGERVYVKAGVFKGVEGFIVQKGNHYRLVVSLDLLMQSVSVEIAAGGVEKL